MKVAVYLDKTMELLGVVDVDPYHQALLQRQRYVRMAVCPELPRGPIPADAPIEELVIQAFDFWICPISPLYSASGVTTFCLVTSRKEALAAWWPKQLWPRRRSKEQRERDRRLRKLRCPTSVPYRLPYTQAP